MGAATLQLGLGFRTQLEEVRRALSEDTNLIRFDNSFYRVTRRSNQPFSLTLLPSTGEARHAVVLQLRLEDLYVERIGSTPFGRYASTLRTGDHEIGKLDHALVAASRGEHNANTFDLLSFLVFCVAESLRNDDVANEVHLALKSAGVGMLGRTNPGVDVHALWHATHNWGNASDAVFDALTEQARGIAVRPRASLNVPERRFYERVNESAVRPEYRQVARRIAILRCPSR